MVQAAHRNAVSGLKRVLPFVAVGKKHLSFRVIDLDQWQQSN
jgi:hypothetical protein